VNRISVKWGVLICIFIGSTCPGVGAIWLFDATGPGHHIVRSGTEVMLLMISGISVMIGGIYLKSFDEHRDLRQRSFWDC
jgi:hypothetical protein